MYDGDDSDRNDNDDDDSDDDDRNWNDGDVNNGIEFIMMVTVLDHLLITFILKNRMWTILAAIKSNNAFNFTHDFIESYKYILIIRYVCYR